MIDKIKKIAGVLVICLDLITALGCIVSGLFDQAAVLVILAVLIWALTDE